MPIAFLRLFTNFYSKLIILLKEILLDDLQTLL